jgi:hypothetical protein
MSWYSSHKTAADYVCVRTQTVRTGMHDARRHVVQIGSFPHADYHMIEVWLIRPEKRDTAFRDVMTRHLTELILRWNVGACIHGNEQIHRTGFSRRLPSLLEISIENWGELLEFRPG